MSAQVEPLSGSKGAMSRIVRIHLSYDRHIPVAPRSVIAKFASDDPALRSIGQTLGLYRREVGFYGEFDGQVGLHAPRCYALQHDLETGAFLLLLEDIVSATNGSRVTGCTPAQARLAITELAKLHAAWWEHPQLRALDWLQPFDPRPLQEVYQRAWEPFVTRMGAQLPDALRDIGERLGAHLAPLFKGYWESPWTLVHNDFQLDNLFFGISESDPPLTVIDWQSVLRGRSMLDVAGFLGGNLTIEDRRANERALLEGYHALLIGQGVTGFTFDDCWHGYQVALLDGFSRMVIAIASNLSDEQARAHREILWPRYSTAVLDLNTSKHLP
jgi:aminoglycoside/choline kinase family phosphotransferase